MSLAVIPVCASCERPSERSISCIKCFRICCTACFSDFVDAAVSADGELLLNVLNDRICRRCQNGRDSARIPTRTNTDQTKEPTGNAMDLCHLHGLVCMLFCLNCSVGICGGCLAPGQYNHDLHDVKNLTVVYRERMSQVESKLVRAQKVNDELRTGALLYGRNYERIEKELADAVEEIEAMTNSSKENITGLMNDKMRVLKAKLKVPEEHGVAVADLQNNVKVLSMFDFSKKHPDIDKKCDQLVSAPKPIALEKADIDCDLIRPYCFETIIFPGFSNAPCNAVHVGHMTTAYGVDWKFTVRKAETVQIEPNCKIADAYRHAMVVTVPHENYMKEIHRKFLLHYSDQRFEVAKSAYVVEQKFCNDNGDLELRIGIRPFNAVVENQLLRCLLSKDAKRYDYNYLIMHFQCTLNEIKQSEELHSLPIKDEQGRSWHSYVRLDAGHLQFYVKLKQGSACKCHFFMELKHSDPIKSRILYDSTPKFFKTLGWGRKDFISWNELNNDDGFHPNGVLTFSFGVRPLPDVADDNNNSTVGAANA